MTGFKTYESFLYQIYKSIDDLEQDRPEIATSRIMNSYKQIRESNIYQSEDLRKYVESIIGSIENGEYSRSTELIHSLAEEIEGYQRYILDTAQHRNR